MKKTNNIRRIYMLLIALIISLCAEGFLAFRSAGHGFGRPESVFSMEVLEAPGFLVDGPVYQMAEGRPYLLFHSPQDIGHLILQFAEPVGSDMELYCHYAGETQNYDRFKRVERYIARGSTEAVIPIPGGADATWIRLDILGSFALSGVKAAPFVPAGEITLTEFLSQVHIFRLFFMLLILSLSLPAVRPGSAQKVAAGRTVYLDAVRTLAALLVVSLHIVEPLVLVLPPSGIVRTAALSVNVLSMPCNALFFLISGALLLPFREESFSRFFSRRMWRVLLPMAVYSWFYLGLCCASPLSPLSGITGFFKAMVQGDVILAPHFWLIYELLGIYLLAVPFRYMLKSMPEQTKKQLCLLVLALSAFGTLSRLLGVSVGIPLHLAGWTGMFLLGYFLNQDWMRAYDRWWLAGGLSAFPFGLWFLLRCPEQRAQIANSSIVMMLLAGAFFVLLLRLENRLKLLARPLAFFSRYSFSVLLVHLFVLGQIVFNGPLHSDLPNLVQVAASYLLCLAASFGIAVITDRTAVAAAENLLERIFKPKTV